MQTPFDVRGSITPKMALVIIAIVVAGFLLAFTQVYAIGYILLAIAAVIYVFMSFAVRS